MIGSPWVNVSRARACAIPGHEGAVKMFTQAAGQKIGSRGITVNNVQPVRSKPN